MMYITDISYLKNSLNGNIFFYFIRVCVRSVRMSSPATQLKGRLLYKAIKRSLGWYWRREGCIWLGGGGGE